MKTIGVISDTHLKNGGVSEDILNIFREHKVDMILHAGDMGAATVADELGTVAPVTAVCGNMDGPDVSASFPDKQTVTVENVKIGLIHGWGPPGNLVDRIKGEFSEENCVVFGHSHHAYNRVHGATLFFNPGSAVDPEYAPYRSVGILTVDKNKISGKIIRL